MNQGAPDAARPPGKVSKRRCLSGILKSECLLGKDKGKDILGERSAGKEAQNMKRKHI